MGPEGIALILVVLTGMAKLIRQASQLLKKINFAVERLGGLEASVNNTDGDPLIKRVGNLEEDVSDIKEDVGKMKLDIASILGYIRGNNKDSLE